MARERSAVAVENRPRPDRTVVAAARWDLQLFDSWTLRRSSDELAIKAREQRLLGLLALQGTRARSYLAGMLWPESTESRASGSLRAAVWQIEGAAPGLLVSDRRTIGLTPHLRLDVHDVASSCAQVRVWAADHEVPVQVTSSELDGSLTRLIGGELLPGWYDDWVLYERARLQQLRLRTLEMLAELLLVRGENTLAMTAAMTAISMEPMRESAVRTLIRLHIADGNYHDAVEEYHLFRRRLIRELGVAPSSHFEGLIAPLLPRRRATARPLVGQIRRA
jgi:DNA-binding SARP family transcriptional activator